jgi:hypothetical protein
MLTIQPSQYIIYQFFNMRNTESLEKVYVVLFINFNRTFYLFKGGFVFILQAYYVWRHINTQI